MTMLPSASSRRWVPACPNSCDHCIISGDLLFNICLEECDPLVPDCPEGLTCVFDSSGFTCKRIEGRFAGGTGDPCEYSTDCAVGSSCLYAENVPGCTAEVGCCTPMCNLSLDDPCPAEVPGTICQAYFTPGSLPPRCPSAELGVCAPP